MAQLPRLYPILDAGCFPDSKALLAAAEELIAAGCKLLQYRNKSGNARIMLEQARELRGLLRLQSENPHFSQNQGEVGIAHPPVNWRATINGPYGTSWPAALALPFESSWPAAGCRSRRDHPTIARRFNAG